MRKSVQAVLGVALVVLLAATVVLFMRYQKTSADLAETRTAEQTARSNYTEAFNAIAEIQDSLNAISVRDGEVKLSPQNLQAEQKLSEPSRAEALESIALLNASIQRTKVKISELEENLKQSGIKVAGLQKMVKNLKHSVTEKQEQVAQLTEEVNQLQTRVTGLETTVQEKDQTIASKDQTIEEKRKESATILYIVGTKKELTAQGIAISKGGVLGLGKTLQPSGRFNEALFTSLDTDQETVVRAPSAKIKILSPQPVSSYELRVEGNQTEIHILDPKEFRKVKHLVIVTA
jgi:predicted RNase H-like nuclease (RuvC/YqgF family)